MRRLETLLNRLEEALEGGGPGLISVCYELPDGTVLEPTEEAKRRALEEARRTGRDYALAYPEERP